MKSSEFPDISDLPLETQVAQRLLLGYTGNRPDERFQRLLQRGLGGVLFFRENFETLDPPEPATVARLLADISGQVPENLPQPFLALDQEGGLVERLPHFLFPSMVSPRAVALALENVQSLEYCAEVYDLTAFYLELLGFNMNLFPTLDVNREPRNPVIGVRSFGPDAKTVWRYAKVVLDRLEARNLLAVGKHFPGHGNGTLDSHEDLPRIGATDEDLEPFRQAIARPIPAIMIAHGYYPDFQPPNEENVPATFSRTVIQELLRNLLGFEGLVLSDDMTMGAVSKHADPEEAALKALAAGIDILIYRDIFHLQGGALQEKLIPRIVNALETGELDMNQHQAAVNRILKAKRTLKPRQANPPSLDITMSPDAIRAVSGFVASKAITVLLDNGDVLLPLDPEDIFWLVHPDRNSIPQYRDDCRTSPDLDDLLEEAGLYPGYNHRYVLGEPIPLPEEADPPELIIFVTYSPPLHPEQARFYEAVKGRYPEAGILLVSAGTPEDWEGLEGLNAADCHLAICTYRPPSIRAIATLLLTDGLPEPPTIHSGVGEARS